MSKRIHSKTSQRSLDDTRSSRRRPRRWWPRILGLAFVALVALGVFGPSLVMRSPLRHWILDQATGDIAMRVRCDSASASWWSPICLRGVSVRDGAGQVVSTAAQVKTQRSLAQLIAHPTNLGLIQIEAPIIHCQLRRGSSNLEDLLAGLPSSKEDSAAVQFHLQIQDGSIQVIESDQESAWRVESCDAEVEFSREKLLFESNGELIAAQDRGRFEFQGEVPIESSDSGRRVAITVKLAGLPLEPVSSLALRLGYDGSLQGTMTGDIKLSIDGAVQSLAGQLQINDGSLAASVLQTDTLSAKEMTASFDLQLAANQLGIRQLAINSDFVDLQASGTFPFPATSASILSCAQQGEYECRGRIDVASLTRQLPETLGSRTDAELSAGELNWDLASSKDDARRVLAGQFSTRDFQVSHSGQRFDFTQPIEVVFRVHQDDNDWTVEQLTGQSTFLSFSGRGNLQDGQFVMRGDLLRLRDELSQFIDLNDTLLTGKMEGRLQWQVDAKGQLASQGSFNATDLNFSLTPGRALQESSISMTFAANANVAERRVREIFGGKLTVTAGTDQLTAELVEPIQLNVQPWPIQMRLQGDLAKWRQRLRSLANVDLPPVIGQVDATATWRAVGSRYQISMDSTEIQGLELQLPGNRIRESAVQLNGSAEWDRAAARLKVADASFTCTSLAMRIAELDFDTRGQTLADARLSYRGDLARLWQWVRGENRSQRPTGSISGRLMTRHEGQQTHFQTTADVADFRWLEWSETLPAEQTRRQANWQEIWHEPRIQVESSGWIAVDGSRISLAQFDVQSDIASVNATGDVFEPRGKMELQLAGQTQVNLEQLSKRLQPTWGREVRFSGRVAKPFRVTGPLRVVATELHPVSQTGSAPASWPAQDLKAEGAIAWDRAHAWGFDVGDGSVDMRLQRQNVFVVPVELDASGGKIQLTPQLRLRGNPRIEIEAGRVIDQVQITPQMCHGWLKYIAPLLADVAAAQGTFSMELTHARIPISKPTASNIEGTLQIHAAQVGPGTTSRQLLTLIQQIRSMTRSTQRNSDVAYDNWIRVPEQRVPFQMTGGRVVHENLTLVIGGVPVQTAGWVALDERMSIVAKVPIQDDWVNDAQWLAGLKGQTVDFPISGTLTKPRIDGRVLNNLTRKTITQGAESMLQQEVQKQLNRLFER